MTRGMERDWPVIVKRAAELVRLGEVEPTYVDIAHALVLPSTSVDSRFREFGITRDILATPDRWPLVTMATPAGKHRKDSLSDDAMFAGIKAADIIAALKAGPLSLNDLANGLDRGESAVDEALANMIAAGYGIEREDKTVKLPRYVAPKRASVLSDGKARNLKFAVASDWHLGSKATQVSALLAFLDVAVKKHECEHILVPGDVVAGQGVYRGQANEVYASGASDQLDALVNTIPKYPGVRYYILGGNHDYSHMKSSGFDIVKAACNLRSDWEYLGYDEATVPLTPDVDIVLWHPSGGVPYALTYRGQKFAAELAQRELMDIIVGKKERPSTRFIFWGHLHVAASFPHGPIRVIGPGCFEGRNSYLKQKGLTPKIQGVVVEVALTDDNLIQRHVAYEYEYVELENDWHNAYNPILAKQAVAKITPMFGLAKKTERRGAA